jgi:hypothetical protein
MDLGTPLHPSLNKVYIHTLLSSYFNNPIMTKINDTDNESYYYSKLNSQLLNKHRYIIAITTKDNHNYNKKTYLEHLQWHSLQTRTMNTIYNIPKISYPPSNILNKYIIKLSNRTNNISSYNSHQIPNISIHLLHTSSNKYEYPHEATLTNAIESFQTLINII